METLQEKVKRIAEAKRREREEQAKLQAKLEENLAQTSAIPNPEKQLENSVGLDASASDKRKAKLAAMQNFFGTSDEETRNLEEFIETAEHLAEITDVRASENYPIPKTREDIKLNAKQLQGIQQAVDFPYSNLIGYAGSGKTTAVLALIRRLIEDGKIRDLHKQNSSLALKLNHLTGGGRRFNFAMCAFTGLAVKTLRRVVPNEFKNNCATIHKLIDFGPVEREVSYLDKGVWVEKKKLFFEPRYHNGKWVNINGFLCEHNDPAVSHRDEEPSQLSIDQLIIDECSMVGVRLWKMLIEAIPAHCKIITIGDIAQLPPVLDVPIQPLLLANWPTVELTEIYRQKDGDMISNANRLRAGKAPEPSEHFKILGIDKEPIKAQKQVLEFVKKAYKDGTYDPAQDILITPMNVNDLGQEMLNMLSRPFTNEHAKLKNVSTMRGSKQFAVGDRVLVTKNDNEVGLYNGQLGWITDIIPQAGVDPALIANADIPDQTAQGELSGLGDTISSMRDAQKKAKDRNKLASMFGSNAVPELEEEEQGTGKRRSSHAIHVQFDYEPEDDPDGHAHRFSLHTSAQIENLIPAWWITIHKSQGSGFRNVFIVLHNDAAKMLCNELLYTAVTRCVEKVTILTTKYAFNKCLHNMRIKGDTLEKKVASYAALFDMSKYPNLKIPSPTNDYKPRTGG